MARTVAGVEAGQRVVVVSPAGRASRDAFEDVASACVAADLDDGLVVRRANGAERVESPRTGGAAVFLGVRGARGHRADLLVLDEDLPAGAVAEVLPVIAAGGELVR